MPSEADRWKTGPMRNTIGHTGGATGAVTGGVEGHTKMKELDPNSPAAREARREFGPEEPAGAEDEDFSIPTGGG